MSSLRTLRLVPQLRSSFFATRNTQSLLFARTSFISSICTRSFMRSANLSTFPQVSAIRGGKKGGGKKEDDVPAVTEIDLKGYEQKMAQVVDNLQVSFANLRTERLSPSLIENIMVELPEKDVDKKKKKPRLVPLRNVADITVFDHRSLAVHSHDPELIKNITKALSSSEGGFSPQPGDNGGIKIPIPKMTIEYREQLEKAVNKQAEDAKDKVRMVRRDAMDEVKKQKKAISKDDAFRYEKQIQDIVDKKVKLIGDKVTAKVREIKELE